MVIGTREHEAKFIFFNLNVKLYLFQIITNVFKYRTLIFEFSTKYYDIIIMN